MALTPFVNAAFTGQTAGTLLSSYVAQSGDLNATFANVHSSAQLTFGSSQSVNVNGSLKDSFYTAGAVLTSAQQVIDLTSDFLASTINDYVDVSGFTIGDDGTGSNFLDVRLAFGTFRNPPVLEVINTVSGTATTIASVSLTSGANFAPTAGTTYTMVAQIRGAAGAFTLNVLAGPKGGTQSTLVNALSIPSLVMTGRSVGLRQVWSTTGGATATAQTDASGVHVRNFNASTFVASTALTASGVTVSSGSSSGSATVTTTAASGGTAPYSYQFQRAPVSGGTPGAYANIGTAGTALSYSDTGLTVGATYSYRVVVTDSAGTPATSTSSATSYTVPTPTFGISTNPTSLSLGQGSSLTAAVSLSPTGGYTGTDTLSVSGLPSGVTAAVNPASIANGAGTATLSLTAAGNAALGTSTIVVSATDGTQTVSTTLALTVTAPAGGVTLDTINNNVLALINGVSTGAVQFRNTFH